VPANRSDDSAAATHSLCRRESYAPDGLRCVRFADALLNAEGMTGKSHGRKSMVGEQQTSQSPGGTTGSFSGSACRPSGTPRSLFGVSPGLTPGACAYHRFAIPKHAQPQERQHGNHFTSQNPTRSASEGTMSRHNTQTRSASEGTPRPETPVLQLCIPNAEGMTGNSHGRKSMVEEQQTSQSPGGTTGSLSRSACRPSGNPRSLFAVSPRLKFWACA